MKSQLLTFGLLAVCLMILPSILCAEQLTDLPNKQQINLSLLASTTLQKEQANTETKKRSSIDHLPEVEILPIDTRLLDLLDILAGDNLAEFQDKIKLDLLTLSVRVASYNYAEQYLLLIAQALQAKHYQEYQQAITLLKRADELSDKISQAQQSQAEFILLHQILAELYAHENQFEQAFIERTNYLKKYHILRNTKRDKILNALVESHEINEKEALNQSLEDENKVKEKRIAEQKIEKSQRRIDFIAVLVVAAFFILLLLRQVNIRKKLLYYTKIDSLTGVLNRHSLFEQGQKMTKHFADTPQEFSLLMFDLDAFKRVNDEYGHQKGDEVLIRCAKLFGETMRSRDVLARLGGEEFCALLPYADHNKAKAIAQRLNEKIAQYNFATLGVQRELTVSVGLTTMQSSQSSFDDLLHCADLALHHAKKQGHNALVSYHDIADEQERRSK